MDSSNAYYTGPVTVTFDEGIAVLKNDTTNTQSTPSSGAQISDAGQYQITVTDLAGNKTIKTFILSQDYVDVMSDYNKLTIGYATGDSSSYVTRNITLASSKDAGSTISWAVTNSATSVDAGTGNVTRPSGSNETVELTATITKGTITNTKIFTITVIAQAAADDDQSKATDDANSAVITYVSGDSIDSVTQNITLSAVGALYNSAITWSSNNQAVSISQTAASGVYSATVTRPAATASDVQVELTATATLNTKTTSKKFVCNN